MRTDRPRALDAPKAREMRQVPQGSPVVQPDLLLERARALQVHRSRHLGKLGEELPRAPRDRPRSAPRPALIADLYFAAALASCAGARLAARHGASSRGIRPEYKPASCGCEYMSSQAGATWGTIKAISVQFAAAFAARSSSDRAFSIRASTDPGSRGRGGVRGVVRLAARPHSLRGSARPWKQRAQPLRCP